MELGSVVPFQRVIGVGVELFGVPTIVKEHKNLDLQVLDRRPPMASFEGPVLEPCPITNLKRKQAARSVTNLDTAMSYKYSCLSFFTPSHIVAIKLNF